MTTVSCNQIVSTDQDVCCYNMLVFNTRLSTYGEDHGGENVAQREKHIFCEVFIIQQCINFVRYL